MKVTLEYLPQFNAFGISDEKIAEFETKQIIPELVLAPRNTALIPLFQMSGNYKILNIFEPLPKATTIGFLMGRENGYYTIDWNHAKAIAQTGVRIRFITYEHPVEQFAGCQGLILPGGTFASPEKYYINPHKPKDLLPRAKAYLHLIRYASEQSIPMLGICAGAEMIGGHYGLKMYRDKRCIKNSLNHKTSESNAHKIFILQDNPLYTMFNNTSEAWVNSRHNECMVPNTSNSPLSIYAYAEDGIPEAWGNEDLGILCIQWHPEDGASCGNQCMKNIYNWIAKKARYSKNKKL
jgi:putative glutamine amidotransferase